ncbi:uncharacterized protein [Salminus brasiliensis]|uniref:uncharacterized protein n=1 Tax=Salminus brasiliensis TaxID=930266 RepID=UPI003B82C9A4
MARLLLLHVIFQGILFSGTWTWLVKMPRSIRGLQGSCLVIPCSFDYTSDPPVNPHRVVWYQYVSRGYPLVYDNWDPRSVIPKFRGKTSLYGNPSHRDCSLLIKDLDMSHHGEKVYPWVDPENVGWRTYEFFDVTTVIHVEHSVQDPSLQIIGGINIGDTISVQCSTYHTCPYRTPTLTLSGIERKEGINDRVENTHIGDGKYQITLKRDGVVRAVSQRVQCSVKHPGGRSATATRTHTAKCNQSCDSSGWLVKMPRSIRGLQGSCLVIPCSFDYSSDPPVNPHRVVWYQYVSRGYPLVYDNWDPRSVIPKFRGKTSLYGNPSYKDCSLLIKDLDMSHHGEQIYPWVDPENVGRSTYRFFDVTTEIHVEHSVQDPSLQIIGGINIGDTISVQCSTYHTCPYNKPTLTLSGIEGINDRVENTHIGDGKYQITLKRDGVVRAVSQRVQCSVIHYGGCSATATRTHTAKCLIYSARITPDSNTEFLEGVEREIICSVKIHMPSGST